LKLSLEFGSPGEIILFVEFDVLTAVTTKGNICWNVMPHIVVRFPTFRTKMLTLKWRQQVPAKCRSQAGMLQDLQLWNQEFLWLY